MSASQDKKRRQSERAEGVDKRSLAEREAAQKARKERRTWTIVTAIVVVAALVIVLLNTNLLYRGTTAVTIGDEKYTNAEFQYYYYSELMSFQTDNAAIVGMLFDTSTDLGKQDFDPDMAEALGMTLPESMGDGEGASWEDYFRAAALDNMREVTALYTAAHGRRLHPQRGRRRHHRRDHRLPGDGGRHLWLEGRRRLRQRHLRQGA